MSRTSLFYFIIALVIFGTIINWLNPTSLSTDNQAKELSFKSDYFIQNVAIKYFDTDGSLENQLEATKLEHFKFNQTSLISNPSIEINNKKQANWHISASNGILEHSKNQIVLYNSVEIKQSLQPKTETALLDDAALKKDYLIQTQGLYFDLNNNIAHTKNDVLIEINSLTTKAKTMYIDFNLAKVDLKGRTETTGQLND